MGDHNQDDNPSAQRTPSTAHRESFENSATEPTDAELAAAIRGGDEAAFTTLFERHHRRIAIIAGRFFQQKEEVEDVIQESFAKAYFAIKDFSDDGTGSIAGWLSKIAFNTCYDELRRRSRKPEKGAGTLTSEEERTIHSLLITSDEFSVESTVITRDLANKLLSRLSAEDRIVLVLLDVEGLSVTEIGQVVGWSSAKVKIRAFRARNELRRILRRFL